MAEHETTSRTREHWFVPEKLLNLPTRSETIITDGEKEARGLAWTAEESQRRASEKWEKMKEEEH